MRILALMHEDLIPPEVEDENKIDWVATPWVTEYDVVNTLKESGHEVKILGVHDELKPLRLAIKEFKPQIAFNILEEFKGEAIFDQNVVSYLELLGVPYTGCNPKGLILARDKALSKKILSYHRIKTPKFQVFPRNNRKKKLTLKSFPLIIKCLNEEASLGLSQASVVHNEEKLRERVKFIHDNFNTDAIAEEFVEGKEYFVGVMGNRQIKALPVWGLKYKDSNNPGKEIYSTRAKFNAKYRKRKGIETGKSDINPVVEKKLQDIAKKTYKSLGLNGYSRIDMRMDQSGEVYVLEANPNPNIAEVEDFADSAYSIGIEYSELLEKIMKLGIQWNPVSAYTTTA